MPRMPVRHLVLALVLLLVAADALAEPKRRMVDPTANRYEALQEFLFLEGYWSEEIDAVLEPLEGVLSLNNGTPDAHLVRNLDDIPGLRPLPEGVVAFLHRPHNVFYVAVGDDRLLVGISQPMIQERRKTSPLPYLFEKYDLINGTTHPVAGAGGLQGDLTTFLSAHDSFLGPTLRLLAVGAVVMMFLALRLRRQRVFLADPVVAAHRFRADAQVFLVAGGVWVGLLAASYGLMHFAARTRFMDAAVGSDSLSLGLTRSLAILPDQMRLISFCLAVGISALVVISLGFWSGALGRARLRSGGPAPAGRP